jgi:hypothetical protein
MTNPLPKGPRVERVALFNPDGDSEIILRLGALAEKQLPDSS